MNPSRESALALLAPQIDRLVSRWRERYDPSARRGVPAHITLLYPWRPTPLSDVDIAELTAVLAGIERFRITLSDFGRFPGVLYLKPEDNGETQALMAKLFAAFPEHPPYDDRHADAIPHLTVAEISEDRLVQIESSIRSDLAPSLPVTIDVNEVAVLEEGQDGMFRVRARIRLRENLQQSPGTGAN